MVMGLLDKGGVIIFMDSIIHPLPFSKAGDGNRI